MFNVCDDYCERSVCTNCEYAKMNVMRRIMYNHGMELCLKHRFWEVDSVTEYSVTIVNHQDNKETKETYMASYFWERGK